MYSLEDHILLPAWVTEQGETRRAEKNGEREARAK
jgi:hypothetical protein